MMVIVKGSIDGADAVEPIAVHSNILWARCTGLQEHIIEAYFLKGWVAQCS